MLYNVYKFSISPSHGSSGRVAVLAWDTHDDKHRTWLQEQARRDGVAEHVLWTGWLPMREGWRYVKSAAVALSPIPRGPLLDVSSPTKVPEYLALGVPVVCNDNPDQQAVIKSTGCGVCVPYTAEDFALAVCNVLASPALYQPLRMNSGINYVRLHRSYQIIASNVAKAYESPR